ncbi:sirohydrochlorin ferrochelatase [Skeletonema marinoi]|uniref:Sirohydrochlorin ferrochelatase n=1 Tax=Skeletonema marinoi TaxID=267567 RepID=A0AAD8YEU9_9STRA|nr:sirohydrochlorin ferrochelatase [Skeletonema marinoi]
MATTMISGLITPSLLLLLTSSFGGQRHQEVSAFSLSRPNNHPASLVPKTSKLFTSDDDDFFDPFLHSPHDYPDGVDNGPEDGGSGGVTTPNGLGAIDEIFESNASSFGFASMSPSSEPSSSPPQIINTNDNNGDLFDPLLSPHAYPTGTDAGPITATLSPTQSPPTNKKLAILLIDHGSKREASNQHLQFIAETYQASIIQRDATANTEEEVSATSGRETVVRAAHMEIAEPSILTSLRNIITNDKVTEIVCVPYFLSPGKHSTVDVPNLIAEAKQVLGEEGLLQHDEYGPVNILSSQALGTQLEFMLGGVDELVDLTLKDGN